MSPINSIRFSRKHGRNARGEAEPPEAAAHLAATPADEAAQPTADTADAASRRDGEERRARTPLGFKIYGILCIIGGLALVPQNIAMLVDTCLYFANGELSHNSLITQVLYVLNVALVAVIVVAFVVFGVRLVLFKRRGARQTAEFIIVLLAAGCLCSLMLVGVSYDLVGYLATTVLLVAMLTYVDPSLSDERQLQRKLRDMETREELEEGTLGRDETGRGYIALDFFNLFWIFVIACVMGDAIETVYHMLVVDPGVFQIRAGMLWGPFSPIYGFGAVLMTIALNRFHKSNIVVIFLVSAVIGGAFEYFVSWFLQFAFGACAWDYTGTFLSIGGRTNFQFMCMWGALGVVWIKLILPVMLNVVNLIPWKWRYSVTLVCAVLMLFNGAMTLITLDCWYGRLAGMPADNAMAVFCADHFDNTYMADRFQSMSIDPSSATRAR